MARGDGKDDIARGETSSPRDRRRYSSSHGDSSRVLRQNQGGSATGPRDAGPPGIPSIKELKALNQRVHEDAGFPEFSALDQPSPLESCLERARAAYAGTPDGIIQTAALLAHGIAQAQSFRDGNRRTAYFATRSFLYANRFGYLTSPHDSSDHTLARYLNQVVEGSKGNRPGPEKFKALFSRRDKRRKTTEP